MTPDLRGAVGVSSFGVLLNYSITNAAAWRQDRTHRRFPRLLAVVGAIGCITLAFSLPAASILVGVIVLAAGLA